MLKKNLYLILIFLVPLFLILIWFGNGHILGGGEGGLYYHRIDRVADVTRWAWTESVLGNFVGVGTSGYPTHLVLSLLQKQGVEGFVIQASVYYLMFVISGISIYFLTKELVPGIENKYAFLAVLFYWFNPISLVNVWNRNLDNYRYFFTLLPLAFTLYLIGIRRCKYYFSIAVSLVCAVLAYGLSATPLHIILWMLLGFTTIFYALVERKAWPLKYFLVTLIFYTLLNFWWLSQFFSFIFSPSYSRVVLDFFSTSGNLNTLSALSERLGNVRDVMRLVHGSFFQSAPPWGKIYIFPISFTGFFVVTFPIFFAIYKGFKKIDILFLGSIFILAIFLVKGNNPPLGEVFSFVFQKFVFLQVFRNPFEKFGFILPVASAPLFAVGVRLLSQKFVNQGKFMYLFFLLIVTGFLGFPFWSKLALTRTDFTNNQVTVSIETKVPQYYKEANDWLNDQGGNFRILVLPIDGEAVDYTWEYPYSGVELSSTIFDRSSISFSTLIPYYIDIADNIERLVITKEKTKNILTLLNVKYVIVRRDIDWKAREMRNPDIIENNLSRLTYLIKVKEFGPLTVYALKGEDLLPKIWASNDTFRVYASQEVEDFVTVSATYGQFISDNFSHTEAGKILIKPKTISTFTPGEKISKETALSQLLHSSHLPSSPVFPLVLFKESLEKLTIEADIDKFIFDITRLGKRSVEIYKLSTLTNETSVLQSSIKRYEEALDQLNTNYPRNLISDVSNQYRRIVSTEFEKHLVLFDYAAKESTSDSNKLLVEDLKNRLRKKLVGFGVLAENVILLENVDNNNFSVYKFEVESEGSYELLLENKSWPDFYESVKKIDFQVDNSVFSKEVVLDNRNINLGVMYLTKGTHEIIVPWALSINLLDSKLEEIKLDSEDTPEYVIPLRKFDTEATYEISFEYFFEKGEKFDVVFNQDNEPMNPKILGFPYRRQIGRDRYEGGYKNVSLFLKPKKGGTNAELKFLIDHYNDCPKDRKKALFIPSCDDRQYKTQFDKRSTVIIKNIKVSKVFDNNLSLVQGKNITHENLPVVNFTEVNPTEYKVKVRGASSKYTLIFSETFDHAWEVIYGDGTKVTPDAHILVNAYANGWEIDRLGDYELTIKFRPQEILDVSKKISLLSVVFAVVTFYLLWKNQNLN